MIKHDLYMDEEIAKCSIPARYAFPAMWTIADRLGRLEYRPQKLKAMIYPYDDVDMAALVEELISARAVIKYEVDGRSYLEIRTFVEHQHIAAHEAASKIPAPESNGHVGKCTEISIQESTLPDISENGEKCIPTITITPTVTDTITSTARAREDETDLPLADGTTYHVEVDISSELRKAYPKVDVAGELKKMRVWLIANPGKRKTRRGILRFINAWLSRAPVTQSKPTSMRVTKAYLDECLK
jgi:hypothetical protein